MLGSLRITPDWQTGSTTSLISEDTFVSVVLSAKVLKLFMNDCKHSREWKKLCWAEQNEFIESKNIAFDKFIFMQKKILIIIYYKIQIFLEI